MNPSAQFRLAARVSALILLICCILLFYVQIDRSLPELREGLVEVTPGQSLSEISRAFFPSSRLNGVWFKVHVILTGKSRKLRAGEYLLQSDSIRSITRKLVEGKVLQYRVTVAEGTWASDIATLLAGAGLGDREKFLGLIHDSAFVRESTGQSAPSLEGFLFPETYFFTKGMTEKEILKSFVSRFRELAQPVLQSGPMSLHESLTLASMVEREAAMDEERPVIAGVFLNRLKKRMPLESCVTVEYALGKKKKQLTESDLRVDSPYNTYRHPGIPPGPVGNPGMKAIQAVTDPARTDYLFFVAQGDGRHIFSKTWPEHKQAKKKTRPARRLQLK